MNIRGVVKANILIYIFIKIHRIELIELINNQDLNCLYTTKPLINYIC